MTAKLTILLAPMLLIACNSSSGANPYEEAAEIARKAQPIGKGQSFKTLKDISTLEAKRWVVSGVDMDPPGMIILDIASDGTFSMDLRRIENASKAVFEAETGVIEKGSGTFTKAPSSNSRTLQDFARFKFVTSDAGKIYLSAEDTVYRIDQIPFQ